MVTNNYAATATNGRKDQQIRHLLNEEQASEILNCSISYLRKARVLGQAPQFVKLGRLVRYKLDHLEEFIAKQTRGQAMPSVPKPR